MRNFFFPLLAILLLFSACPGETEYERVNESTDCFEVVISPSEEGDDDDSADDEERGVPTEGDDDDSAGDDDDSAGDDDDAAPEMLSIELHARPGYFDQDVIGEAMLTPGGGPAGTRFDLSVVLEDTGNEQGNPVTVVQMVSVLVDNGDVTLNEFQLSESPADERRFVITLQAGGDPAQVRRTDQLCVALYTEI